MSGENVWYLHSRPNREETLVRYRLTRGRGWAWKLAIPVVAAAVAGQLALAGAASAGHTVVHRAAGTIAPSKYNDADCNAWSNKYKAAAPAMRMRCTDVLGPLYNGHRQRFYDNGHYVGHDEPSVKFISSVPGSSNTFNAALRL